MDATTTLTADPVELIRRLDATVIRSRLEQLGREREALLVLLRAARRAYPDNRTAQAETEGGCARA